MKCPDVELDLVVLPNPAVGFQAQPARWFHPKWMYCTIRNDSEEPIFVYGARHESETTTIPTSLFLLPAGRRTPHYRDCKGVLIPMGRDARVGDKVVHGPVALKYRDLRPVCVRVKNGIYYCPSHNGILTSEQVEFPVLHLSFEQLLACPRRMVRVR